MALLFCDSVRHYNSVTPMAEKWSSVDSAVAYSSTGGRKDGASIRIPNDIASSGSFSESFVNGLSKRLAVSGDVLIVGFRLRITTDDAPNYARGLVGFRDGTSMQCCLALDTGNHIVAWNGAGAGLGPASTEALILDHLHHVEVKVVIHDSTGSIEVRVDTEVWLNLTNIDTKYLSTSVINDVIFGQAAADQDRYISDIVIMDDTGSTCHNFIGEVNVDPIYPDGAGYYSDWEPSTPLADNYTMVDEASVSGTDYVSTETSGAKDSYTFGILPGNDPDIKAVVANLWAIKSNSGVATLIPKTRISSADYDGDGQTVDQAWQCLQYAWEVNPATSSAWTKSDVDGAEFGVELD